MTETEKGIMSDAIGIIKRIERANGIKAESSILKPKRQKRSRDALALSIARERYAEAVDKAPGGLVRDEKRKALLKILHVN